MERFSIVNSANFTVMAYFCYGDPAKILTPVPAPRRFPWRPRKAHMSNGTPIRWYIARDALQKPAVAAALEIPLAAVGRGGRRRRRRRLLRRTGRCRPNGAAAPGRRLAVVALAACAAGFFRHCLDHAALFSRRRRQRYTTDHICPAAQRRRRRRRVPQTLRRGRANRAGC